MHRDQWKRRLAVLLFGAPYVAALAGRILRRRGSAQTQPSHDDPLRWTPDEGIPSAVEEPLRPGWSRPVPETLPQRTYWPSALALGVVLVAWGLTTTYLLSIVGLLVFARAVAGWIGDVVHGYEQH